MRWLVALCVVRAGEGPVLPGAPFAVATSQMGDELVALDAARDAKPEEIPAELEAAPLGTLLSDLPPLHEERMAAIADAVAKLTDADFTQAGNARVASLKAVLGFDPTGAEIARGGKRPV